MAGEIPAPVADALTKSVLELFESQAGRQATAEEAARLSASAAAKPTATAPEVLAHADVGISPDSGSGAGISAEPADEADGGAARELDRPEVDSSSEAPAGSDGGQGDADSLTPDTGYNEWVDKRDAAAHKRGRIVDAVKTGGKIAAGGLLLGGAAGLLSGKGGPPGSDTPKGEAAVTPDDAAKAAGARSIAGKIAASGSTPPPSVSLQMSHVGMGSAPGFEPIESSEQAAKRITELEAEGSRFADVVDADTGETKHFGEQLADKETEQLNDWAQQKGELKKLYLEAKERVGWGEAMSIIGSGIARLAAGLYGMRTGVDTSGAKFDYGDWSHQYQRVLDEYKVGLEEKEQTMKARTGVIQAQRHDFDTWQQRLEAARGQAAQLEQQKQEFNTRGEYDAAAANAQRKIQVMEFNANADNAKKIEDAKLQFERERLQQHMTDEQYTFARGAFTMELGKWDAASAAYHTGLGQLAAAGKESDPEKREKLADEGLKNVSAFVSDPGAIVKAVGGTPNKGFGSMFSASGGRQDFGTIATELSKLPTRDRPAPRDFAPGGRKWQDVVQLSTPTPDTSASTTPPPGQAHPTGVQSTRKSDGSPVYQWSDGSWRTTGK